MKKAQIKITTNNQATQEQVAQPTPCSKDIKESVRSWYNMIYGGKYYFEIYHMLRMAVTNDYLNSLDMQNLPESEAAGAELLQRTADATKAFKEILLEEEGIRLELDIPDMLAPYQIAKLIQVFFHAVQFSKREMYGDDYMPYDDEDITVMVYLDKNFDGECYGLADETGTYIPEYEYMLPRIDSRYDALSPKYYGIYKDVEFWLKVFTEKVKEFNKVDGELIPIRNGILDSRTKKLIPFSPEYLLNGKYSPAEYVESENGPVIWETQPDLGNRTYTVRTYTVDEWLKEFRARLEDGVCENSGGGN